MIGFVPRGISRCPCAVSVNTKIVTFGGALPLTNEVASFPFLHRCIGTANRCQSVRALQVYVFDTVRGTWRDGPITTSYCPHGPEPVKPFPRCCATAVAYQGSVFVYGGWHNGPLGTVLRVFGLVSASCWAEMLCFGSQVARWCLTLPQ
jgi:hypothetical protein